MKYLKPFLKKYLKETILAPLFKMLEATFDLLVPLVVAKIINDGVGQQDAGLIWRNCGLLVLMALVGLLCSFTAQYFAARAATGTATGLRKMLFSHIQGLGYTEMDVIGESTLITRMTSDINQVQNGVNMFLRLFLRSPFIVLGAMVMAFTIDADIALIFAVAIPVLSVIVFGVMKWTHPLYKRIQGRLDQVTGAARESFSGVRVIRAFGKEERELKRFEDANEQLVQLQLPVGRISALMNPLTFVVVNLCIILILWIGGRQVDGGLLLSGDVIALVNLMSQILVELVKLANLIVTLSKAVASAQRVAQILDTKTAMQFPEKGVSQPEGREAVRFMDVSLSYAGAGDASLSHISFTALKGQTIGVIGGTGSGKSTLVQLIPRFYDATEGQVRLLGHPIGEWEKEALRQRVGIVPQKARLFRGTIRSNLLWGNEQASEEELWQALSMAQAADFVKEKPLSLDDPVEQGGRNLSGGQRQRLTIARALVKMPEILILDDSSSALDYATDAALRKALARVLMLIRPYGKYVGWSLLCAFVQVCAALLIPVLCGNAIDYMIDAGRVDFGAIFRYLLLIGAICTASAVAQWVLSACNNRITFLVSRDLRNGAMEKIQRLPLSYLDAHPAGDLVSRLIADVDTFGDGLLMGFTQLFTGVLTIAGTLGIMIALHAGIALIVVVLTPLSLFVASFIARSTFRYFQEQTKVRGEQTALINELIEGQRVVQAFSHEDESQRDFDAVNDRLRGVSLKAVFFSSLTNPSTRLVNNIVYAAVGLVSALLAADGKVSVGDVSVFLSYASQYAKPFNEISGVVTELQNALACAGRIFELMDEAEEPSDAAGLTPFCDGRVQLEHVSFRYVEERPLIEDFSLDVQSGQRIAIVGPTGCGKTTLINLLMRFYDVKAGCIRVSDTDIRQMKRHALRGSFGMVLQDTWLKKGTIRENIAYGREDAGEEEIIAAAKAAHAHSFIRRLPKGYDTEITENGENLSQGQRQLLCIARVMLCLPPMLILDEATSSIDTRTEIRIQAAFHAMMQGRTSFIVAHRLSTIRQADVILVMKNGNIVEKGSHDSLMQQQGFYAHLYNSQYQGAE